MKPGLRIDSLRIEGFGHFSRFTRELGPGLHLLYGPNEAGKSTMLAFLRSVLFGFEERGQPERYEPESGGPFGGELRLSTAEGPLCVRRTGGRKSKGELLVLGPDGEALPESRLRDALAHVPRELFFEVFAFRLDELSSFQRLTEQRGVSEALFAAGMQGARRLPEAVERLRKDLEGLYKPGGQKPELNRVLKELEEVQARLRQEGDRPARYFECKERLAALDAEGRRLESEVRAEARELERLSRLEAALGDVAALAAARAELAELPVLDVLPEAGEARLEEALHKRRGYRVDGAQLAERLAAVEAELARLAAPSPVREREEALRLALAAYSERAEGVRALPSRRAALAAKRRQVEGALAELGLSVDAPGLLALDLSAGARAGLEALASKLEAEEAARREAGGALSRARLERERLDGTLARLDTELADMPAVRPAQVRQQRLGLGRLRALRVMLDRLGEQRDEVRRQYEAARGGAEPAPTQAGLPAWWVPTAAAGALVLAAVAGWFAGGVVAAVCLVGGLLLVGLLEVARRKMESAHHAALEAHAARQRVRQQEEERLRAAMVSLATREQGLHRELVMAAAEAGMTPVATAADLATREVELEEDLEVASRREGLQRDLEQRREERDEAEAEERRALEALNEVEARHAALSAELAEHLAAQRLPPSLPPAAAMALWRDAAALRQRLQDVAADEAALGAEVDACAAVTSRLWAEAVAAGLASAAEGAGDSVEAVASRVAGALETTRTQEAQRLALEERLGGLLAEKARLDGLCHEEELALALLLAEGGGGDEEFFRRRAAQARRYKELTARARELSQRIEARTGLTEPQAREALRD
ncbi:MAG TPA: AAA family ATPase, partial [Myxococcus sp.]|nr:AAA family ATPase [Myxococcus sp.]